MPSTRFQLLLVVVVAGLAVVAPLGAATSLGVTTDDSTANDATGLDPDETVEDGGEYRVGQTLVSDSWNAPAVEFQQRVGDSWAFVAELPVSDGRVTVNTGGADPGQYRLVADDADRSITFRLRAPATETTAGTSTSETSTTEPTDDDSTTTEPTTETSTTETSASEPDASLEDGGTYWVGQTLGDDGWRVDAVELEYREDGDWLFVSDLPVEDDRVRVHTVSTDPGQYRLVADGTTRTVSFRLRAQTLDASVNASVLRNSGSAGETTATVSLQSNRAGYDVVVTSPDLNGSTLDGVLDRGEAVDTDDDGVTDAVVVDGVSSTAEVTANFRCLGGANRTLTFAPVDASATANATVTVEAAAIPDVSFAKSVVRAAADGVVRVPVGIDRCADHATVVIGTRGEPVSFVATVADPDDDGRAVLLWNTSATQTVDAALAAGDGTTLVDATRRRPDGDTDGAAVNDTYALSLFAGNGTDANEVDVAAAVTDANEGDSPAVDIAAVDAPTALATGDDFAVAVTVENAGESAASTTVRLVRDGENVSTKAVDIAADATEVVTFSLRARNDTGTARYRVVAGDANATFEMDVAYEDAIDTTTTPTDAATTSPSETTPTATTEPGTASPVGTTSGSSDDATGMPGFGLTAALVALAGVALLARRRD